MRRKGHELTDQQIQQGYDKLQPTNAMPDYFYGAVALMVGPIGDARLLDVGCGNGYLLRKIRHANPQARLYGLDLSDANLAHASAIVAAPSQFSSGSCANALPFADESFDIVVSSEVIEHLKEPKCCLREMFRILRPEGRLVLAIPNGSAWGLTMPLGELLPPSRLRNLMLPHEHPFKSPQPIDTVLSWSEISTMVQDSGFKIIQVAGVDSFPYFFESVPAVPLVGKPLARSSWMRNVRDAVDNLVLALGQTSLYYRVILECRPSKGA